MSESQRRLFSEVNMVTADHCDLLLDAMDKELDQLQIHPRQRLRDSVCRGTVSCGRPQSESQDTGVGSTEGPLCGPDLQGPVETRPDDGVKSRDRFSAVQQSHHEEALWRLRRLLGDSCGDADTGSRLPPSDSICTEEFAQRFRQEMVHEPVPLRPKEACSPKRLAHGGPNSLRTPDPLTPFGKDTIHPKSRSRIYDRVKPPQMSSTPRTKPVTEWNCFVESLQNLDELWKCQRRKNTASRQRTLTDSEKYHTAPRLTDPPRPLVDDGRDAPKSSASDRAALKQRLSGLQQKCLEEDTVLSGKKSQLSEVERALGKLQQKKQESLREIAQLRERTGRLERERNTLESLLSKAEEDCVRWDLQALQRDSDQTPALKAPDVSINERQQRAVVEPEQAEAEQNTLRRSEEEERASHWALQLLHEVRRLQELLPVHRGPKELPQSPTVEDALWALRSVRQQLQSFQSLQLSDDHMNQQGEPRCQKKQLWTEKDQQRLLQVHTTGQSGVQTQGTSAGVLARLKERLRDKDSELQQLQANMTQWKELTAHKIACKYEEQLSAELQRCKAKVLQSRRRSWRV